MKNTSASEIIEFFESSFADKHVIPLDLELVWLKKAIGRYSKELTDLTFDEETLEFNCVLDMYVKDTLAQMMKKFYQERELSKVNKRVSIVGKEISIDGSGNSKTAAKNELNYVASEVTDMVENQKPTAYV